MRKYLLIVDDEESIRQSLTGALTDEGIRVTTASSGVEALESIRSERPDCILLDIWMPGMDGLETLKQIKAEHAEALVIMMSGHGNIETAVKATKWGAYDFIEKPLSLEKLLVVLQNAFSAQDLSRENQALRQQVKKHRTLIGNSPKMRELKELIQRVAPTTGSVLITGENGTGKELVAHSIHALSPRFSEPFVEVNCAAIPEELIESELFGHEKGAFTGATQLRRGKFDLAHQGTLFLDEIGDMSMKTQAKILRILQEKKFERVGGSQTISVDARIVAATNKDLRQEIQQGRFREDLFYRLNVIPFVVSPLRERKEDIPLLVEHFLREFSVTHGRTLRAASPEAMRALIDYPWPGNVRELKNFIERIVILSRDGEAPLTASEILAQLSSQASQERIPQRQVDLIEEGDDAVEGSLKRNLKDARQDFEREFILRTLKENGWNISKAAQTLGIERSHLHRKIKSFGIDPEST